MKHLNLYLTLFMMVVIQNFPLFSQIVIDQSDMPSTGDTLRVSSTIVVQPGYAATAMDTTWDFAALEAMSQRVDTFISASATPVAYQYFFVMLGGANLASPRNLPPIPGLSVTNGFTYFKNSVSSFSDLGSAYTVQGVPLPAKYDVPDKYYQFPMNLGSTWSSTAAFEISVPGFAYFGIQKSRSTLVDGWGTLITPYGTFQTIRVKSTVIEHDSIYFDSISQGISIVRNITEYKWLAKGQGIPVLQITEEGNLVTATYRDIYRMSSEPLIVSLGPDTAVFAGTTLTLTANISNGTPPYQVFWNTFDTSKTLTITVQKDHLYSVMVVDAMQNFGSAQIMVSLKYQPGVEETAINLLAISPNPTNGHFQVTIPKGSRNASLKIYAALGNLSREFEIAPGTENLNLDISDFPNGVYLIKLSDQKTVYSGKLMVIR